MSEMHTGREHHEVYEAFTSLANNIRSWQGHRSTMCKEGRSTKSVFIEG